MKILVFCPTYKRPDGSLAIHKDAQASIDALEFGEHDVRVWINPSETEDRENNIINQYKLARQTTLDGGYDAVLFIEHDMIVPPDALVKLADVQDAGVVYGVYMFRHGKPVLSAFRSVSSANLDQSLQYFPSELKRATGAKVWPVSGIGFGCTLVKRYVFDQVEIRKPVGGHFPDGPLASDCQRLRIPQKARFDVLCGHIRSDGYVLWPMLEGGEWAMDVVKIRVLKPFNANIGGVSMTMQEGESRMPLDDAMEYQRAGYVAILDRPPAVKIRNRPTKETAKAVK